SFQASPLPELSFHEPSPPQAAPDSCSQAGCGAAASWPGRAGAWVQDEPSFQEVSSFHAPPARLQAAVSSEDGVRAAYAPKLAAAASGAAWAGPVGVCAERVGSGWAGAE